MPLVSDNSSPMENIIGSPASLPSSDSISQLSDNLWSLKKIRTPVPCSVMSFATITSLLVGGAPPKKLTPAEEEVEIRKSILGAYQTTVKGKALTVSKLNGIWSRIKMLEKDLQELQDKPLSSCGNDREMIGSMKTEFRSLLSFVAPDLRGTRQLCALIKEVFNGRDLERAQIFTGSIGKSFIESWADGMMCRFRTEFLMGDAPIHPLHGNTTKTSIASFGVVNTTQTGKMKAESYEDPLLPQKNNRARELEYLSNFAFLGLIMCYAVLYFLYSAFLGKKGSNTRVMTGLHIWTALLMLLLFMGSFIRFSVGTLKVMRLVMSGLLLVSSSLVFILLQLSL